MKKIIALLFVIVLSSISIYAGYRDTGFIKWKQPNGVEFTARYWGDEFFDWMETKDGYRIIQGIDKYYYYAILNKEGDFSPSVNKGGIDKPLEESKGLVRSSKRISWLEKEREEIQKMNSEYFNSIKGSLSGAKSSSTVKKLGVILVDFPSESPEGYLKEKFDELFFSVNTWIGTNKHPEGHLLFGSVYDYYLDQLNVEVKGKNGQRLIVNNPASNPDYPEWMTMQHEKSYYAYMGRSNFNTMLINEAKAYYGETLINSFDDLLFVFAGINMGNWKAFGVAASPYSDNKGVATASERDGDHFRNIGVYCHELGHTMFGFGDQYIGSGNADPHKYSLMSTGIDNGPSGNGECPAPISPGYKIKLGLPHEIIGRPTIDKKIYNGNLYKIEVPNHTNEFFVVERYYHSGWYQHITSQSNNNEAGITVWHFKDLGGISGGSDFEEIEYADNHDDYDDNKFGKAGAFGQLYPDKFDESTFPSSKLRNGYLSDLAIVDIYAVGSNPSQQYGMIDVLDPAPGTPSNFSLSGSMGQHPILSWSQNGEPDLAGYKIYRYIIGETSSFVLRATVGSSTTSWTDNQVTIVSIFQGPEVRYRITAKDQANQESAPTNYKSTWTAPFKINADPDNIKNEPSTYSLGKNYPNPFNPSTTIKFSLKYDGLTKLTIYNILGQVVTQLVNKGLPKGSHSITFNASNLSSGIYFYRLESGDFVSNKKMLLIE